jgi:hypothetical protein
LEIACGPVSGDDNCGDPRMVEACGECGLDEECVAGECWSCEPETDESFCARYAATCGELQEQDSCGDPRTVESCGDCDSLEVCTGNQCRPLMNDDCASAEPLVFVGGRASAQGIIDLANHSDGSLRCGGTSRDVVYSFTTTEERSFDASLSVGQAGWIVLHLRSTCEDVITETRCSTANASGLNLAVKNLPAGSWYLWVDSTNSSPRAFGGAFVLEVQLSTPPTASAHDTCAGAIPITLTNGSVTVTGTTSAATDGGTGSCGTFSGDDVVYAFTLSAPAAVVATVTRGTSALFPGVYLRRDCMSGAPKDEIACGSNLSGKATAYAPHDAQGTPS